MRARFARVAAPSGVSSRMFGCQAARHFRRHRALQFVGRDLNADHVAMEAHTELAEAQRADRILAAIDGLDVLDRHRRPVWNS